MAYCCYECGGEVVPRWLEDRATWEFYCKACGKIQWWDNMPPEMLGYDQEVQDDQR